MKTFEIPEISAQITNYSSVKMLIEELYRMNLDIESIPKSFANEVLKIIILNMVLGEEDNIKNELDKLMKEYNFI